MFGKRVMRIRCTSAANLSQCRYSLQIVRAVSRFGTASRYAPRSGDQTPHAFIAFPFFAISSSSVYADSLSFMSE